MNYPSTSRRTASSWDGFWFWALEGELKAENPLNCKLFPWKLKLLVNVEEYEGSRQRLFLGSRQRLLLIIVEVTLLVENRRVWRIEQEAVSIFVDFFLRFQDNQWLMKGKEQRFFLQLMAMEFVTAFFIWCSLPLFTCINLPLHPSLVSFVHFWNFIQTKFGLEWTQQKLEIWIGLIGFIRSIIGWANVALWNLQAPKLTYLCVCVYISPYYGESC